MSDSLGQKPFGPLRSYGRIKSRPIKARQAGLMDSLLPAMALDIGGPLDPRALKPDAAEVWLEIGFGGGEHMAAQAGRRPDALILGAEPFLNGVASAVRHIQEQGVGNVRLHHGDARDLMAVLPDAGLDRAFILFPDPWPKTRHHKRRLIQGGTVAELARLLKPGGVLRFATDWADYADWTLERVLADPAFAWTAERADDWRRPPADHVTTRYEEKKLGDCAPVFLDFVRR
ncbi:MAG: putative S-adenosylmethionine-dependent methyltransferase [Caulobacteraceae bacterium]|jgi:tRNA (guanine-N7-)-methyltransferase|nr:putative S-adenosylmethionine-dependent methyltransferase [Caulobacteraceae bacterium]